MRYWAGVLVAVGRFHNPEWDLLFGRQFALRVPGKCLTTMCACLLASSSVIRFSSCAYSSDVCG